MSTTSTSPRTQSNECKHCTQAVSPRNTSRRGYCSSYCYHAHQGAKVLTNIRDDHKFCYTCFNQIKEVEPIPHERDDDWKNGYQYPTQHARVGLVDQYPADSIIEVPDHADYTRTGIVCECGQTHHRNRETVIQEAGFREIVENLYYALHYFKEEGRHDYDITAGNLADALREQTGIQGWDFELAIGHAIQDQ